MFVESGFFWVGEIAGEDDIGVVGMGVVIVGVVVVVADFFEERVRFPTCLAAEDEFVWD